MSDKSPNLFGWDLLYSTVESDVHTNQDVLICLTHLVLISNGFKCIGIGDSKILDGTETKSESLPRGWNDGYAMRYIYQGRLYNLKATSLDDGVIINLIRVDERTVSMIQLNTRSVVQRSGSLDQMMPDATAMADTIKKQLIDKIVTSTKTKDGSSQTRPESSKTSSGINVVPPRIPEPPRNLNYPYVPNIHPIDVGRADLDPFGLNPLGVPRSPAAFPGGGGMLFVPPNRGGNPDLNLGIPGGSIPPGARFDPFRPPDVDRFPRRPNNRPDNDEMPPPGFDDMFM